MTNQHKLNALSALLAAVLLLAVGGCEKKASSDGDSTSEASEQDPEASGRLEESAEAPTTVVDAPEGWKQLDETRLSSQDQALLDRAQKAQRALGGTLLRELTAAVSDGSYADAIEVCNERAPAIAKSVSDDRGLAIGRTSFKLRNPDNAPPAWAEPYVERRVPQVTVLRSDDKLAYLLPIRLGEMCANCHGPSDKLAEGVSEQLAELYPQDEATGFKTGDLRGWFWVEVPES